MVSIQAYPLGVWEKRIAIRIPMVSVPPYEAALALV